MSDLFDKIGIQNTDEYKQVNELLIKAKYGLCNWSELENAVYRYKDKLLELTQNLSDEDKKLLEKEVQNYDPKKSEQTIDNFFNSP